MDAIFSWLREFVPSSVSISQRERLRSCLGALIGIFMTGWVTRWTLGADSAVPILMAPMGASAVLLFALPRSPLAQPWSIIGGNMVSAAIGVTCSQWIGEPVMAASVAIAFAIAGMLALRCLHPPSGAVALTAVVGGPLIHAEGYRFLLAPIGINSVLLLLVALLFNNATRHRYPHSGRTAHAKLHGTADAPPVDRIGFTTADLDYVLQRYNEVLDVGRDDLESLLMQTEMHAYQRRLGEVTCADIMSRDVISVEFGTTLQEAWDLLHRHRVVALPVTDRVKRVIGIVTLLDFIRHADLDTHEDFGVKLRRFVQRLPHTHSEKPEVVGQIMTHRVHTVTDRLHIAELVPLISKHGLHHIPVVDSERRLVGIVTNSDLVAGLYRGRLTDLPSAT